MLISIPGNEADILVREDNVLIDDVKEFTFHVDDNEFHIHTYDDEDGTIGFSIIDVRFGVLRITPLTKGKIMIEVEEEELVIP